MYVALISTDSRIFSSSVRSVYVRALTVAGVVLFPGSIIVPYWKEHQSDAFSMHSDDGNPTSTNIKQALRQVTCEILYGSNLSDASPGNPVKEILFNLNLPDIANCFTTCSCKDVDGDTSFQ
ncbi:hypothetical protein Tco_1337362 [Tanacetum coccineum]